MAQDRFINVTLDKGAAKKPDIANHSNDVSQGATAAASDFSISFDSTKINSMNALESCLRSIRASAASFLKAG
jgi:hypothetical protein